MIIHEVIGGGGLRLHAREWGNRLGLEILFLHGWSQCHLCWTRQYESSLADEFRLVAFDLRGHGMSDRPLGPENYTDPKLWADDVAAVMSALALRRPILVAWSYAGLVVSHYLRAYGQDRVGGINFVGAALEIGPPAFGTLIGPGFLEPFADATSEDLATNIDGIRRFLRGCTYRPVPQDVFEVAIAWNMVVPPQVRSALAAREFGSDDVLEEVSVPVLVTHGEADQVVLPAMAQHVVAVCPTAEASWYREVGHMPQVESADRFNAELAELAQRSIPRGPQRSLPHTAATTGTRSGAGGMMDD